MSTAWYCVLGAVFVAYFVLGGLDQGVVMLLPTLRGDDARRSALNAIGPMFLGNEVWIVGAVGVLIAAFPRLEAELFHAAYPALIAAVLGLAALNAGVRLCGPLAWRDRPDFTCFQAGSETAAIARGVTAELGPLKDTQPKPEAGPFSK